MEHGREDRLETDKQFWIHTFNSITFFLACGNYEMPNIGKAGMISAVARVI